MLTVLLQPGYVIPVLMILLYFPYLPQNLPELLQRSLVLGFPEELHNFIRFLKDVLVPSTFCPAVVKLRAQRPSLLRIILKFYFMQQVLLALFLRGYAFGRHAVQIMTFIHKIKEALYLF